MVSYASACPDGNKLYLETRFCVEEDHIWTHISVKFVKFYRHTLWVIDKYIFNQSDH